MKDKSFYDKLIDDDYRYHFQMVIIPLFFGSTSLIMFLINVLTHKTVLLYVSLAYSIINLLASYLQYKRKIHIEISYKIFEISILALCTFFVVTGGTEGVSNIWIILLSSFGVPILGKKRGFYLCLILFAIIIFFLWTPVGDKLVTCERTTEFRMRFPGVYVFSFILGYILEEIRLITYVKLRSVQKEYEVLSNTDSLTQVFNRRYFTNTFAELLKTNANKDTSCLIFIVDIDNFKSINDNYGHLTGDQVLVVLAQVLQNKTSLYGWTSRWGGEEFMSVLQIDTNTQALSILEEIRQTVERLELIDDNSQLFKVTISLGAFLFSYNQNLSPNEIFKRADKALYQAKENGKNQVVFFSDAD